jgi:hypothetical protein
MWRAYVIEVDGDFVGAGIDEGTRFRFMAVHPVVEDIDQSTWPSLEALRRGVAQHIHGQHARCVAPVAPLFAARLVGEAVEPR